MRQPLATIEKDGRAIAVGDAVRVICEFDRVIAIEPYSGSLARLGDGDPVRIARFAAGDGMTLFPDETHEVLA
jgi:hypothetical protein